jgi:hypothetical protein
MLCIRSSTFSTHKLLSREAEHFGWSSRFDRGCISDLRALRRRATYLGTVAESRRRHRRFPLPSLAACDCGTSHFFWRLLLEFPPLHAPSPEGFVRDRTDAGRRRSPSVVTIDGCGRVRYRGWFPQKSGSRYIPEPCRVAALAIYRKPRFSGG